MDNRLVLNTGVHIYSEVKVELVTEASTTECMIVRLSGHQGTTCSLFFWPGALEALLAVIAPKPQPPTDTAVSAVAYDFQQGN